MTGARLSLTARLALQGAGRPETPTESPFPYPEPSEVPAGPAAAAMLRRLMELELLQATEPPFTRYFAAVCLSRVLDSAARGTLTDVDDVTMKLLEGAVQELAADLVALGIHVAPLE